MWVLGLNGRPVAYHDATACLVGEAGRVAAFAEEERFTRSKHGIQAAPRHAAEFCLAAAGVEPEDIDVVAIGWDVPKIRTAFGARWDDASAAELIREMVGPQLASGMRARARLEFVPHHLAHAAAAFHSSGFTVAAVLVVDGQGEDASISVFHGDAAGGLRPIRLWPPRFSLGFLYEAATEWLGFGFLEAGKTMALSSFGRGRWVEVEALISLRDDELVLNPPMSNSVNAYDGSIAGHWRSVLSELVGRTDPAAGPFALAGDPASVHVAWVAQRTVERLMIDLSALAREAAGTDALCLAGGVALNCVANGLIREPVYVPPVPNDVGVALGAAWTVCPPAVRSQVQADLGLPIERPAKEVFAFAPVQVSDLDLLAVLDRLSAGQVGAIAEGRAEIGPRALGRRSIIALPSPASVADRLNRIKGREPWRPFGPVIRTGQAGKWWEHRQHLHRYMAGAVPMTERGSVVAPAVRHVDGTTRPQVIGHSDPSVVSQLLATMERAGLAPVLVNTSFNRRGEPIVNSVSDALEAFLRLEINFLVLGDVLLSKSARS